jgi:hypothetical protein
MILRYIIKTLYIDSNKIRKIFYNYLGNYYLQHLRKSLNPWRAETRLFRVSTLDSLIFPH